MCINLLLLFSLSRSTWRLLSGLGASLQSAGLQFFPFLHWHLRRSQKPYLLGLWILSVCTLVSLRSPGIIEGMHMIASLFFFFPVADVSFCSLEPLFWLWGGVFLTWANLVLQDVCGSGLVDEPCKPHWWHLQWKLKYTLSPLCLVFSELTNCSNKIMFYVLHELFVHFRVREI